MGFVTHKKSMVKKTQFNKLLALDCNKILGMKQNTILSQFLICIELKTTQTNIMVLLKFPPLTLKILNPLLSQKI